MGSESGASARFTPKSTSHKNPPNDGQTLDKKMRKPKAVFAWKKRGRSASTLAKFQIEIDQNLLQIAGVNNPDPGPFLLRLTRDMVSSGENPQKAPELALRATESFELGDTYAMLGQIENSILCYTAGLEIQRQIALDINRENGGPAATLEEAEDRRLMGFVCDAKGSYESALQHYVLASLAMAGNYEQKMFDEARSILEKKYGPPHPDSTGQ
ncbi:PROTEIN KINESIN LIGHT CHAIN-RELATED 2, partial [Salix viminalis]